MLSVEGTCEELTLGDLELADNCSSKLLNMAYPDGRTGFYFVLATGQIITFTGMDGDNPTPETDVIHIDKVIASKTDDPANPDVYAVEGFCEYGNPYAGPMTVSCEGITEDGDYVSGVFTTNGKPPT